MGSADEVNIQASELNRSMKVRRPAPEPALVLWEGTPSVTDTPGLFCSDKGSQIISSRRQQQQQGRFSRKTC